MDNSFEDVPFNYLRVDSKRLLLNPQYLLQLDDIDNPDEQPGRHWFVDTLAYEAHSQGVYLCEFTFSKSFDGLKKRLKAWSQVWPEIKEALVRDLGLPSEITVRPWVFLPEDSIEKFVKDARKMGFDGTSKLPALKITPLEMTLPWHYRSWKRRGELEKPETIPPEMR